MVDEILIVDTGSYDGTPEIAKLFGAHVFHLEWTGDFSSARNASLERATGAWILTIDADECISPSDYENFTKLLQGGTTVNTAFLMETRNYSTKVIMENWMPNDGLYPAEETGAGWFPSVKIRLFPNRPDIRFDGSIHEMVRDSVQRAGIEIAATPLPIHHYGYLDKERQQRKENDYYLLGMKKLAEMGSDDYVALFELAIQAGSTGRYEEAVTLWNRAVAINNSDPAVSISDLF
jgi:glycosyltransferase involved in cell wall biosynthesis